MYEYNKDIEDALTSITNCNNCYGLGLLWHGEEEYLFTEYCHCNPRKIRLNEEGLIDSIDGDVFNEILGGAYNG